MQDLVQRLVDDKADLDGKIDALEKFMTTDMYEELDAAEKRRLYMQSTIMNAYSAILYDRICNFREKE